jgi:cell division protein FtsN
VNKKTIIYIVLGIVSAVVWFYLFWIPLKTDFFEVGSLKTRHFNPFYEAPAPPYFIAPDTLQTIVASAADLEPIDLPVEQVKEPVFKPYHLIVGSFSYLENAERLKETLWTQGKEVQILQTTIGFNRVSEASFKNYKQAFAAWKLSRNSSCPDAWILKVKQ